MNRLTLRVALVLASVSAFADHSTEGRTRRGGTNAVPAHQPDTNNTAAHSEGKRGTENPRTEKQEIYLNHSATPAQGDQARPGSGKYNRELLR